MPTIKFTNKITGGVTDHLLWTFGDDTTSTSTDINVFHTYPSSGDYTASLEGWSVSGQYEKKTEVVTIAPIIDRMLSIVTDRVYIYGIRGYDGVAGDGKEIYRSEVATPNVFTKVFEADYPLVKMTSVWGVLMAMGLNGVIYKSIDNGLTWTKLYENADYIIKDIISFDVPTVPVFMVAGYGSNPLLYPEAAYSSDGINWSRNSEFCGMVGLEDLSAYGLACNGSTAWVIGGYLDEVNSVFYSSDGINFNFVNDDNLLSYANSIASNGSTWVAVGYSGVAGKSSIIYSLNGIDWVSTDYCSPGGYDEFIRVTYGNGMFIAGGVCDTYHQLAYSYNGIDWFEGEDPFAGSSCEGYTVLDVQCRGSQWFAITGNNRVMSRSYDGLTWTPFIPGNLQIYLPISIAFNNAGRMVCVGTANYYSGSYHEPYTSNIAYSDDSGDNWINLGHEIMVKGYYPQIVCDGNTFVLSNDDGYHFPGPSYINNTLAYSLDGVNWVGIGHRICEWWNQALGVGNMVSPPTPVIVANFKITDYWGAICPPETSLEAAGNLVVTDLSTGATSWYWELINITEEDTDGEVVRTWTDQNFTMINNVDYVEYKYYILRLTINGGYTMDSPEFYARPAPM